MDVLRPIDLLPFIQRAARTEYGAGLRRRIGRLFPDRTIAEREAILRGFLRYRFINRGIYRTTIAAPVLADVASRCVPIDAAHRLAAANARAGPLIVATAHFGSLYLLSLIVARALRGRRIYLMHKTTIADSARNERFLRGRGIIPVGGDERGLRTLVRAIQDDPAIGILIAFDPPLGNRHSLPFLSTELGISMGIGLLADLGGCAVLPVFWNYAGLRPWISVDELIVADAQSSPKRRRLAVIETLFRLLEARVARTPEQWQLDFLPDVAPIRDDRLGIGFPALGR